VVSGEERGGRLINHDEARVVRRIFEAFAVGRSSKAIARQLNKDVIAGPRDALWRDTTIRGHRSRGTGVLNNELYVGRLVWNRQRFIKDPRTGKRVSRHNPQEAWVVEDVPDLRIIDEGLWARVKARQAAIDASPKVQALKVNRFWEHRRPIHLLTGLVTCACCGGSFISAGSDYLACGNSRKLGTCEQRRAIRRSVLEEFVLDLVRERLMQPEMVKALWRPTRRRSTRGAQTQERSGPDRKGAEGSSRPSSMALQGHSGWLPQPGLLGKSRAGARSGRSRGARGTAAHHRCGCTEPRGALLPKVAQLARAWPDSAIRDEALGILPGLITGCG
jgi:hypothetical protein